MLTSKSARAAPEKTNTPTTAKDHATHEGSPSPQYDLAVPFLSPEERCRARVNRKSD